MFKQKYIIWVFIISLIFIAVNTVFMYSENFMLNILPLVLLIAFAGFFYLDKLILVLLFFVPLSIPLRRIIGDIGIDMFLPTEPILFGVLLLFIFKILLDKQFDKKILLHPVSIAIYINIIWLFITAVSSTMFWVSIKFVVARLWFVVAFYFIATQIFKNFKRIKQYNWFYIGGLLIVVFYTWVKLAKFGFFDQKVAHSAALPFFSDHTSYGAVLAMYFPFLVGVSFSKTYSGFRKRLVQVITIVIFAAIIFSYTRAAWISLIPAIGVWIAVKMKIKFRTLVIVGAVFISLFLVYRTQVVLKLEKNKQDSSTKIENHIKSISNVSSDASNLERLNRWNSAIRMFKQKPYFGWGPGTYMFKYAPFQHFEEKTIISTNAGNRGNAHSEYLGPLAESGLLGTLSILLIITLTVITALRVYKYSENKQVKLLAISSLLGLITYYAHGFLNNFLDTDKASAPFWGFTAIIVVLDVYYKNGKKELNS